MKIDINKKYRTRDGKAARIVAVDMKDLSYPIVALITHPDSTEHVITYTTVGSISTDECEHFNDLIEIVPTLDFYVRVYTHPNGDSTIGAVTYNTVTEALHDPNPSLPFKVVKFTHDPNKAEV
jgi:hypothetical protein